MMKSNWLNSQTITVFNLYLSHVHSDLNMHFRGGNNNLDYKKTPMQFLLSTKKAELSDKIAFE